MERGNQTIVRWGQGKQDGKKRLLQNDDVLFEGRSEGRRRRPRSLASKVKQIKSVVMASGVVSIASKVRDVHT